MLTAACAHCERVVELCTDCVCYCPTLSQAKHTKELAKQAAQAAERKATAAAAAAAKLAAQQAAIEEQAAVRAKVQVRISP